LKYLFETFGESLSDTEKQSIEIGIKTLLEKMQYLSGDQDIASKIEEYVPEQESEDFKKLKGIKISKEDYIFLFNTFFILSDVPQRSKL